MSDPQPHTPVVRGPIDTAAIDDLVESGPFGLVITDGRGLIQWINTTLSESLGIPAQEMVGQRTFQSLLPAGGRIYFDTHVRPLLHMQSEVKEIAFELVRSDGTRWPVLMNARIRGGSTDDEQVIDTVVFDATHRRSYEAELLEERRLAELAEARLQVMYEVASGMAAAITTEEIVAVVDQRGSEPISGARCSVWLFEDDLQSIVRLETIATEDAPSKYVLPPQAPALDILASDQMVIISNRNEAADQYPLLCAWMANISIESAVIAPLNFRGPLSGVISYGFSEAHDFGDGELAAVTALVKQTEQAMRRADLVERELRSKRRREILLEFTSLLSGALRLTDVIEAVENDGRRLLQAATVHVALVDETHHYAQFLRSGVATDVVPAKLTLDAQSIACAAVRSAQVHAVADRYQLEEWYPDSPILADVASGAAISVPLVRGNDETLGACVVSFERSGAIAAEDRELIELFAAQISQAIQRAALHDAENLARAQAELRRSMSEALNRAVTTDGVVAAIAYEGVRAFDAAGLAVFMRDPKNPSQLVLAAQRNLDASVVAPSLDPDQVRSSARMNRWNAPLFIAHEHEVDRALNGIIDESGWAATALMPLGLTGTELGLVILGFDRVDSLSSAVRVAIAGLTAEASVALGRAQRFETNRDIALTLQQSMLPEINTLPGWDVSAWYEPGSELLLVGGDMFDVTEFDDGRIVVVVGDVVGHGLEAAAAMGSLRSAAKVLALLESGPADLLDGLHSFAATMPGMLCSSICVVELDTNGHGRYASAGHPLPILRHDDATTELLSAGRSPLLGLSRDPSPEAALTVPAGSTLILITDGLIDDRRTNTEHELDRLQAFVAESPFPQTSAKQVVDHMVGDVPREDDIVVLCLSKSRL